MYPLNAQPALTNVQAELLKVFAMHLSDEDLNQLRFLIALFLMEKINTDIDKLDEERGYDESFYEKLVNSKSY